MPASSKSFDGSQEPLQPEDEKDNPTLISVTALPKDLDPHGNFGIQHRVPNFFVLVSSSPAQLTSAQQNENMSQGNWHNGERKEEMQVLVNALNILARSKTPLKTHVGDGASSDIQSASSGEKSGKQYAPDEVMHTSTDMMLAIGLKSVEATPVKAFIPGWLRIVFIFLGLGATFASHAINMFYYPRYQGDEGTYMMYAWAVTHGSIQPYAYGYGHPPLAWILIAAWVKLTGGFFTFGDSINSGRALMLFLSVLSAYLVYSIVYRLNFKLSTCLFAMLVFALSPISITFQREVLLDNFAAFWFLLALYLIIIGKSRLFYTISAGICFGFAILSKEVLLILFPALIYVVWLYTARFQRKFLLVSFFYAVVAVSSTFVLMAVLKGELIPYEWHLPWDSYPHLSFIGTYLSQAERGQSEGSIHDSWLAWVDSDPLFVMLGVVTPVFNLIFGWWNRKRLFLALFAIIFWWLLLRGGVVFPFYIIPLIPLIALNAAITLDTVVRWLGRVVRFELVGSLLILVVLVALIPYDIQHSLSPDNVFSLHPTLVQSEAAPWIRAHVPHQAMIVISPQLFTDLREPESEGAGDRAAYPYAHVYWFVGLDPAIHDTLLKGNWNNIDYIAADSDMLQTVQTYGGGMNLIKTALNHSVLLVQLGDMYEFVRVYRIIHSNHPPNR